MGGKIRRAGEKSSRIGRKKYLDETGYFREHDVIMAARDQ